MSGQPTEETQCAFCQIRSAALAWFAALAAGLTFAATATPSTALAVHRTRLRLLQVVASGGLNLGGTTPLSFRSSPAQVGITDDGARLLVSTKDHGAVDAFALGPDGRPASAAVTTATGPFPFAFVFDARGRLVLADASGSANTYRVLPSGALSPAGTAAANGQEATCWLVEAPHYFYATNTASDTITGYLEAPGSTSCCTQATHRRGGCDPRR